MIEGAGKKATGDVTKTAWVLWGLGSFLWFLLIAKNFVQFTLQNKTYGMQGMIDAPLFVSALGMWGAGSILILINKNHLISKIFVLLVIVSGFYWEQVLKNFLM